MRERIMMRRKLRGGWTDRMRESLVIRIREVAAGVASKTHTLRTSCIISKNCDLLLRLRASSFAF